RRRAASSDLQQHLERLPAIGQTLERLLPAGERDAREPSIRGERAAGEELERSGEVLVAPRVRPGDRRLLPQHGEDVARSPGRPEPASDALSAPYARIALERCGR